VHRIYPCYDEQNSDSERGLTGTKRTEGTAVTEIKLLIVDDLEHVRQGLRTILELAGDLKVVGEASNGLEAIQRVNQLSPDVVLMDLSIPHIDGLEATQRIKAQHPETGVVMITIHDSEETRERATKVGVDVFLAKGTDTETLIQTIQEVGEKAQGMKEDSYGRLDF
jgi:DNA-binding NarL/FixJ family response regulator